MTTKDKTKKAKVAISREVLNEAGPKKKAIRNQPAECVGCGDKPNAEFAEDHMQLTLVTESDLKRSKDGKQLIRCKPCENEFGNRKKNSKTLISLRDSIWKIDEVLAAILVLLGDDAAAVDVLLGVIHAAVVAAELLDLACGAGPIVQELAKEGVLERAVDDDVL